MTAAINVKVTGLNEFRRELRRIHLTDDLKAANVEVAQLVVDSAVDLARTLGRMEAKASESLRANRQAAKAAVTIGSERYAFALGAEFGSNRFAQFRPWRGSGVTAGYFLWPSIRSERDRIVDVYGDRLEQLAAHAFPD